MLDLHCHILPGVDDGAVDLTDSLAMARAAIADGSRAVVATSHLGETLFDTSPELLRRAHAEVVAAFTREGVPLEVHPGAENFFNGGDPEAFAESAVGIGAANRYVLFDFSLRTPPPNVTAAVAAIRKGGRTPIIAHPERNLALQDDPTPIAGWIDAGALIQVNAPSLIGALGTDSRRLAARLLASGAAHLLASDAHNLTTRVFSLKKARGAAVEIVGEDEAERMTRERPWKIVRGEPVEVRAPRDFPQAKRGLFTKIWSRGPS
jgi:protein-tyrosine phosphatase